MEHVIHLGGVRQSLARLNRLFAAQKSKPGGDDVGSLREKPDRTATKRVELLAFDGVEMAGHGDART
jgi:hypothetical protein